MCEYCITKQTNLIVNCCGFSVNIDAMLKELSILHHKTDDYNKDVFTAINFCPFCGRPLSEPEPLTLDELQNMNGKPVYIIKQCYNKARRIKERKERWDVVSLGKTTDNMMGFVCLSEYIRAYGTELNDECVPSCAWLAYKYLPSQSKES